MNFLKQIEYWKNSALSDLETAEILIEKDKRLHGLFFCHIVIEKILKAHFVKHNNNYAPKSHNLFYLADNSNLLLNADQLELLAFLMKYQLEGRYPGFEADLPDKELTSSYLQKTKELLSWLISKLQI